MTGPPSAVPSSFKKPRQQRSHQDKDATTTHEDGRGAANSPRTLTCTLFSFPVEVKAIPSVATLHGSTWRDTTATIMTRATAVSTRKFFSLKAPANRWEQPHAKIGNSPENAAAAGCSQPVAACYPWGVPPTPHPVSHQFGVSGGGGDHPFTPTWCGHSLEVGVNA